MSFTCPQCGVVLNSDNNLAKVNQVVQTKLRSCSSCDSSLLIENNTISLSDLNVAKNTEASLFEIDHSIVIKGIEYKPRGYSLYGYNLDTENDGRRVEWELSPVGEDSNQSTYFLNQEDENVFLVKQIPNIEEVLPAWESLQANTQLKIAGVEWLVVEKLQVKFVAYYGSLQNLPLQNEKLKCTYLSNTEGECLVLTFQNDKNKVYQHKAYQGWWLDPMDLS